MADYERVIEFLRDFRTAAVQTVTDEVRDAATEYARLCTGANDRLRQCTLLLQRGLRSEAINLAEANPNLLDLMAALDLPDPEGWAEFCQRSDLPVPPALQMERAAQLNDAYGQDQPLEHLFAKHRRLALAQSPIVQRLDIMRQIAQLDPSPFWEKDIRLFETARFKELRVSFSAAVKDRNVKTITALTAEVLESPWYEAVPPDIAGAANDVNGRMRAAQFETSFTELLAKLRTAFAAKSLSGCKTLLNQVKELREQYGKPELSAESKVEVESIKGWVRHEDQLQATREAFDAARDALTTALNADASDAELDTAYRAAASHDQPLPPELQERYDLFVRRRAGAGRRKMVIMLAGVAAVLLIALGIGWTVMQRRLESGWADKIAKAAKDRNLPLARQYVEEQEKRAANLNASPSVAAAKKEVAVLQEKWNRDEEMLRKAVGSLVEAAKQADAARKADDAGGGSDTVLHDLRAAQSAVEDALTRRKSVPDLSWVDGQNRLQAATNQLGQFREDLRGRLARAVLGRAEAVATQADRVTAEPKAASLAAADKTLSALEQDLSPLRPYAEAGGAAEAAIEAAIKKIAERRGALGKSHTLVDAKRTLAAAASTASSAAQALQDFARKFPDEPASKDFTRAAANVELNTSVEIWHAQAGPWFADPVPANEKGALQRLDAVRSYLRDFPWSPFVPRAEAYANYLQQMAEATAVQNSWQTTLGDILTQPLVADLKYLQSNDGVRYYVLSEPNVRKEQLNEQVTYSFEAMDAQNLSRRRAIRLRPPKMLVSEKPALLPHAIYARTLAENLKTADRSTWETFGPDLLDRIVAEDKIDIVVKAIILREALAATVKVTGWALADVYEKPYNDLVRQKLDAVVWYDVDHPVPEVTVTNLKRIFQTIPKAATVKPILAAKRAELFKSLQPMFAGTGMLLRDDAGKWTIQSSAPLRPVPGAMAVMPSQGTGPGGAATSPAAAKPPPVTVDPFAAELPATPAPGPATPAPAPAAPPPSGPGTLVRVATWKDNGLVVDEAALKDLPEGTMVFLMKP